jgi:cyclophilin family peptidyl-prolyl cis-trans isomerase
MKRLLLASLALALAATGVRAANPVVVIDTSLGAIKVELDQDKAPVTVKNFLSYVDDKFYDGTVFHRVMKGFMIQGGGFETGMDKARSVQQFRAKEKRTKAPIKNESDNGLSNKRGTIAMARTDDPNSATAQFFINVVDNPRLDRSNAPGGGYCVFGKVVDGLDVVDKIRDVSTHAIVPRQLENIPNEDVVIKSIRRVDK